MWKFPNGFEIDRDGKVARVTSISLTAEKAGMLLEMYSEVDQTVIRKHYLEWKLRQWDASLRSTHEDPEYLEFMKEWIQDGHDYWYSAKGNPPNSGYIPVRGEHGTVADIARGWTALYDVGKHAT